MRREIAVYTEKDELLYIASIDEGEIESFMAQKRAEGFRAVDIVASRKFFADVQDQPNPTDRGYRRLPIPRILGR